MKGIAGVRAVLLLCVGVICFVVSLSVQGAALKPSANAIASAHPLATQAGMDIFEKGGNAFDAAVAVAAALAVVEPYGSGLGGGGFWLLHDAARNKDVVIDSRERAPLAATKDMFLNDQGDVKPYASLAGPLSAAIPGVPAALVYLAENYGELTLAQSLAPAIQYADYGFPVNLVYQQLVSKPYIRKLLQHYPSSARIFLHNKQIPRIGTKVVQKDLAKTLKALALKGHDGFYDGPVAQKLVSAVTQAGGIWTLEDLKAYQIELRAPLYGQYKDVEIVTVPPPSTGGVAVITMLNILDPYNLAAQDEPLQKHYIIEAMRLAYWDGANNSGDPDYIKVPVNKLISSANAKQLRDNIKSNKATKSETLEEVPVKSVDSMNTTHFSIIDTRGNRVSATLSLNLFFGSGFVAEGTGVLLNDEMDDFTVKPGVANVYGLVGSDQNIIEPGKRPVSSMTPVFLVSDDRVGILGTTGGSHIPTIVLLGILDFAAGKDAHYWVSQPRYHHQYIPDQVQFEPQSISEQAQQQLQEMAHELKPLDKRYGNMQAIIWDKKANTVAAASQPGKLGKASVN